MYFIIFLCVAVVYSFILITCLKLWIKENLVVKIKRCAELMITPLLKGIGLSIFICLGFISIFYLIDKLTSFSFIVTSFDGNSSNQTLLDSMYNGRTGLCLFFAGNCMLYEFISQLYKVPT